ncbi:MAG: glycosyltransferase family 2 protein [Rubripirellula sp.]
MTTHQPKVSVITVVYNDVDHIEATIESVLAQTCDSVEHLVIDGGSTDGTADVIQQYADRLAYSVSEPDKGLYDAMNKGIAKSTGKYISILNCGDEYLPGGMEALVSHAESRDLEGVSGNMLFRNPFTGETTRKDYKRLSQMGRKCFTNQCCSIFRRDVYDRFGPFDLSFKIVADVDFYLKVEDKLAFEFIDEDISVFSLGGVSSSCTFKRIPSFCGELKRLYRKHSLSGQSRRLVTNFVKFFGMSTFSAVASEEFVVGWVFRRYRAETRRLASG